MAPNPPSQSGDEIMFGYASTEKDRFFDPSDQTKVVFGLIKISRLYWEVWVSACFQGTKNDFFQFDSTKYNRARAQRHFLWVLGSVDSMRPPDP
jgi:hypothetical protein